MQSLTYQDKLKSIYEALQYLIFKENLEENDLMLFKNDFNPMNRNDIKVILYIISKIAQNHQRQKFFFQNIEAIIISLKKEIKQYISNFEIFDTFKNNKRFLYFLIKEEIIILDKSIINIILNDKYSQRNYPIFFYFEIKPFISDEVKNKIEHDYEEIIRDAEEDIDEFNKKRNIGENDKSLYQMIQNDSVEEFIASINKVNYPISSNIEQSIFETNSFLLKNHPTLIEYSAFFGSIQIFKYLFNNGIELEPTLWLYAIHGNNPDIIHFLEENSVVPNDDSFLECLIESIKCHHNDIMNYLIDLHFSNTSNDIKIISNIIKYYNIPAFPTELTSINVFYHLCQYNYVSLVEYLLKNSFINNINEVVKLDELTNFALNIAIEKGNIEIVRLLLDCPKINVNCVRTETVTRRAHVEKKQCKPALYLAIEKENLEIVKLLLNNNSLDINQYSTFNYETYRRYNEKKPSLNFAIEKGCIEIVKLIISHSKINIMLATVIDINERRDNANSQIIKSPLITAIDEDQEEIVKLLLTDNNVDVNHPYILDKKFQDYSTGDAVLKIINFLMKFYFVFNKILFFFLNNILK